VYLDVAGFYNDYSDLAGYGSPALTVERQPVPHVLASVAYVNSIRGTTTGVEVSPDWRPIDWLQVKAAYALLAIDMETRPGTIDASNIAHYEGSSPQHQGSVRVSLLLPRRIGVDLTHRFAARLMSGRVPAYQTADARAECWLSDRVSVAVGGANRCSRGTSSTSATTVPTSVCPAVPTSRSHGDSDDAPAPPCRGRRRRLDGGLPGTRRGTARGRVPGESGVPAELREVRRMAAGAAGKRVPPLRPGR
jgi:hypothetical protein